MASTSAVAPVVTYLFHRLEERFDGRPTLIILDEAWLFLDNPLFASRLREWLKTLRKKNVAVVFATQSLSDISESKIAPAIVESCPTRIFLPNPRAVEQQQSAVYEKFGLNPRQIEIVARATSRRDYYFQSPLGAHVFELGLGPVALAFCGASSPADQKITDAIVEAGEPFAASFLTRKNLEWAAELLSQWPGGEMPLAAE